MKQIGKLDGPKGPGAKLTGAIAKACDTATVGAAVLLDPAGLGFDALGPTCEALGLGAPATVAEVATCLGRILECRTDQTLETATPRLGELLDLGTPPGP